MSKTMNLGYRQRVKSGRGRDAEHIDSVEDGRVIAVTKNGLWAVMKAGKWGIANEQVLCLTGCSHAHGYCFAKGSAATAAKV